MKKLELSDIYDDNLTDNHYLKPLKRIKRKYRIGVIDCETWGLNATPSAFALGVCLYESENNVNVFVSENYDEFKNFILDTELHNQRIFYAHNGGCYDYLLLFRNMFELFGAENVVFNDSRFISATYVNGDKSIIFYDSYNIFNTCVSEIGRALGIPKLETPTKFSHDRKCCITKTDIDYCVRDCEIIYYAIKSIEQLTKIQKPTIASIALNYFRRNYLQNTIVIDNQDIMFRDAYYGGRVEAYKLGEIEGGFVYDINSLYPYAMLRPLPNPASFEYCENVNNKQFKKILENFEGMARITVKHPQTEIGYLPYRRNGELLFPVGKFTTTVCFPEIRYALRHNVKIEKIHYVLKAQRMDSIFKTYVNDLYEKKQNATGAYKLIYKFLLNSLYGKFGEVHDEKTLYTKKFEWADLLSLQTKYGNVTFKPFSEDRDDGYYVIQNQSNLSQHSIFSFCSYITSNARVINAQYQDLIRSQGNTIYYTDTDSFVVRDPLCDSLVGDAIGKLKLENYHIVQIKGNKDYVYSIKNQLFEKIKGVKKDAKQLNENMYMYNNIVKLKSALKNRRCIGSAEYVIKNVKKRYNNYTKRIVLNTGYTIPIKIKGGD